MKKVFRLWTLAMILVFLTVFSASAEHVIEINAQLEPRTQEETLAMLSSAKDAYFQDEKLASELEEEINTSTVQDPFSEDPDAKLMICTLAYKEHTMWFLMDQIGEPDANGLYPLYITLHGGGESDDGESNNDQWMSMYEYYRGSVKNGIYIACRGITDTWDLHFQPASYPLYDRLIQTMIYRYHADPNRVYLLGFSAGGDGVYQITPRMADRFAAANMSSGHPNGVSLRNLANCPFSIQVGVRDYYSDEAMRCIRGAEYEQVLTGYHDALHYGYEHQVLVHVPEGHNYTDFGEKEEEVLANPTAYADPDIVEDMLDRFLDALAFSLGEADVSNLSYFTPESIPAFDEAIRKIVKEDFHLETVMVDSNAVHYVSRFVRNPAPETVVWDLSTRAASREVNSFYWLKADDSVTEGTITAFADKENNTLTVTPEKVNGDFSILVNPVLMDVSRPISIVTPEGTFEVHVNPSMETMLSSMLETGDPELAWVAEIPYSQLQ